MKSNINLVELNLEIRSANNQTTIWFEISIIFLRSQLAPCYHFWRFFFFFLLFFLKIKMTKLQTTYWASIRKMADSKANASVKIVAKWRRRSVADEVTMCWICGRDLEEPRTLPCLHSFCSECLLVLLQTYEKKGKLDRIFRCPLCKTLVPNYIPEKVNKFNEPRHDKTNKLTVCPAKTQISLGIRPVWLESSLCAQWVAKDPSFLETDSEDSDQTGRMPRPDLSLRWAQTHFVGFVCLSQINMLSLFWHST